MPSFSPDRYNVEVREFAGAKHKAIFRRDLVADGNRMIIIPGLAKSRSELEAVAHPHNVAYLDGAARGPFYDSMRGIFSLDHHEECIRQITDSTCVQGMNLARTRVIPERGFTIVGNDPDLDTVGGGWALLNADLIAHDDRVFRRIQPLMLVEGNIDGYGKGYEELLGLPADLISDTRKRLDWLMKEEREIKARGRWGTTDFIDFTEESLRRIDQYALFRDSSDMPVSFQMEEKRELTNGQKVHFIQAPDSGIYEVELTVLNHHNDKDCACVIFHDGKAKWTIKLSGFVNDFKLSKVSEALNAAESLVKSERGITDAVMLNARWGGGDVIMGAPRYPNGSGPLLDKQRIFEIVVEALNGQIVA